MLDAAAQNRIRRLALSNATIPSGPLAANLTTSGHFPGATISEVRALIEAARRDTESNQPPPRHEERPRRQQQVHRNAGNRGRGNAQQPQQQRALHKAQYRFVPLNEQVVTATVSERDLPDPDKFSATLTIDWVFDTPVLVGGKPGQGDVVGPIQIGGQWAIPGATLRGMIRSVVETASFSRLGRFNRDARFSYRDFTNDEYKNRVPSSAIKAGWLRKRTDGTLGYEIIPTANDGKGWGVVEFMTFGIDWPLRTFPEKQRRNQAPLPKETKSKRVSWAMMDRPQKARVLGTFGRLVDGGRRAQKFKSGPDVVAGAAGLWHQKTYEMGSGDDPEHILVWTGAQPLGRDATDEDEKLRRYEYVFERDPNEAELPAQPLTKEAWQVFEYANCRLGKKGWEADGAWKELKKSLVDKGTWIPVFWVGDLANQDDKFALGVTRLFKIPHHRSVKDLAALSSKGHLGGEIGEHGYKADLAEALFGYVIETKDLPKPPASSGDEVKVVARRGRVDFGFAWASQEDFSRAQGGIVETIQGAPKPSFDPFYLVAETGTNSWSNPQAKLAGRKRFLPRYPAPAADRMAALTVELHKPIAAFPNGKAPENVKSKLAFLVPHTPGQSAFQSQIRLHNVSAEEAGAIIWALTWGGDETKRHMIGRAKGFGAGQARANITKVVVAPNRGQASIWTGNNSVSDDDTSHARWMKAYADFMTSQVQPPDSWSASEVIKALLASADPRSGQTLANADKLDSLALKDFGGVRRQMAGGRLLKMDQN